MWTYYIREGELWKGGLLVARRLYSGADDGDGLVDEGEGMNDASKMYQRNVGPIPVGHYIIGPAFTHPTIGPLTMRLIPKGGTDTKGRDGFLIHGGSAAGGMSHGCIVAPNLVRSIVADSRDRDLEVIAEAPRSNGGNIA